MDRRLYRPIGFVCWAGDLGPANTILMSSGLANLLNLIRKQSVSIEVVPEVLVAESVELQCVDERDYSLMNVEHDYFERHILNQGALVAMNQLLPVWLRGQERPIHLKTVKIVPSAPCVKLSTSTEAKILPPSNIKIRRSKKKSRSESCEVESEAAGEEFQQRVPPPECRLRIQPPPGDELLPMNGEICRDADVSDGMFISHTKSASERLVAEWFTSQIQFKTALTTAVFLNPDTAATAKIPYGGYVHLASAKSLEKPMMRVFYSSEVAKGHCVMHDVMTASLHLRYGSQIRLAVTEPRLIDLQTVEHHFTIRSLSTDPPDKDKNAVAAAWQLSQSESDPAATKALSDELSSLLGQDLSPTFHQSQESEIDRGGYTETLLQGDLNPISILRKCITTIFRYGGGSDPYTSEAGQDLHMESPLAAFLRLLIACWLKAQIEISWKCHTHFCDASVAGGEWTPWRHSKYLWISPQSRIHVEVALGADRPRQCFDLRLDFTSNGDRANDGVKIERPLTAFDYRRYTVAIAPAFYMGRTEVAKLFPSEIQSMDCPLWLEDIAEQCVTYLRPALVGTGPVESGWSMGLLLHGNKKIGKTSLISAVCRRLSSDLATQAAIYYISCRSWWTAMRTKPKDFSRKKRELYDLLDKANETKPSVVVLDDVGMWWTEADSSTATDLVTLRAVLMLRSIMDDIRCRYIPVVFIGTCGSTESTNESICKAGIFDKRISIPGLDTSSRSQILTHLLQKNKFDVQDTALSGMDQWDAGYVYADLERLEERIRHSHLLSRDRTTKIISKRDVDTALVSFEPEISWRIARSNDPGQDGPKMEDVGGLVKVKAVLKDSIEFPLLYPEVVRLCPLRIMTNVLLYGSPGTGKTYMVNALRRSLNVRMILVKGPELLNKYVGQSEAAVRATFKSARDAAPCVLFFDEFDALGRQRGQDNSGVSDRVVNQMLVEMDGVESSEGFIIIAASSRPDLIDKALLRPGRIDNHVFCPLPDQDERRAILSIHAEKINLDATVDLGHVIRETDGYSGADLASIISEAHIHAVSGFLKKHPSSHATPDDITVTDADIRHAVDNSRASTTDPQRKFLEKIYSNFSSGKVCISKDIDTSFGEKRLSHA